MIRVIPISGDRSIGFHAAGHSGSAPRGSDIICAAVSALTQTAYLALAHYGIRCRCNRHDESGVFTVIADDCEKTRIILTNMYCGLIAIADQHPQHLRVAPFQEVEA